MDTIFQAQISSKADKFLQNDDWDGMWGSIMRPQESVAEPNLRPGNVWGALATPDSSHTTILLSLQIDIWCFPLYGISIW